MSHHDSHKSPAQVRFSADSADGSNLDGSSVPDGPIGSGHAVDGSGVAQQRLPDQPEGEGQQQPTSSSSSGANHKEDKQPLVRHEEIELQERGASAKDTVLEVREGGVAVGPSAGGHKAKSVSHWYDSRISVEMHLALYIEDLMMLAPGVAGEGKQTREGEEGATADHVGAGANGAAASSSLSPPSEATLPDFDEDAEPDITLAHVLAGVEYLLKTRIIGNANPAAPKTIQEEEEEEAELEEDKPADGRIELLEEEEKKEGDASGAKLMGRTAARSDADLGEIPAALAAQPASLVSAGVTDSSIQARATPASKDSSYFYFVSLDLALCDDLVTALCFHMRRAEQKWSLRPKASAEAMKAMELFEGFFTYVYSFRCCVSARSASYLREALKVSRHLRSSNPAHRRLVCRLLLLLVHECPRIERWEDLVEADEQPKIREMLKASEFRKLQKRLAGQANAQMEREASVSHMASVKSANAISGHTEPGATASAALSFPAFFSKKHNTLLPPKGSLFDVEPARLVRMFRTNQEKGLSSDEIEERQAMYGRNELPPPKEPSFLVLLWDQLKDFIILVMLAASVVSMGMEDWKTAGVLLFVILINVVIGLVQEHRSGQALKALSSFSLPQAQVIRDGETTMVPAADLVPGDCVVLDEGANVPADLRLLQVSQLHTIEAILTGESLPILKSTAAIKPKSRKYLSVGDRVNMAFMSTLVTKGRAIGLVVNTGATTEVGRIYSALNANNNRGGLTPLQKKLAVLGKWLVAISIISCALVIAIGLGRDYGEEIVEVGISLAVSVIPEGLVTVVTLTMAVGVQRMAQRKAIVRNLTAVETLGSVTTICSDKTGTLTEGKMKTEAMWVLTHNKGEETSSAAKEGHALRFITASKVTAAHLTGAAAVDAVQPAAAEVALSTGPTVTARLDDTKDITSPSDLPAQLQWSSMIACMNNNAQIKVEDVPQQDGSVKQAEQMVGDATEVALLRAAQQVFCDVPYWENTHGLKRVLEFAFDSDRKRMSVILALPAAQSDDSLFLGVRRPKAATHLLLVKGAPESILNKSNDHLATVSAGVHEVSPLTEQLEERIENEGSRMASQGMRVLATGFRFMTTAEVEKVQNELALAAKESEAGGEAAQSGPSRADLACAAAETDFCFVGLAGIMDPPRVEVAEAIRTAHVAGIRVVMITGDHYDTALAIAKQIGIFSEERGDRAMNGDALAVLSEEQLAALTPFPVVFSRVTPDGKLKLVKSLQRRGEVAAMTGDGVNDSPAIKAADIGIAMGLSGTEVTRQAADIILTDDNFTTIVSSVEEGRRIYDNIVKFLVYLLTCNGAEVLIMLISVCAGWEVPYLPLMILWANIFVDIPPSLALGLEKVDPMAMARSPRTQDQSILPLHILMVMTVDAFIMALIVILNYWYMIYERNLSVAYARSFAFLLLAIIHLLHAWVSSSLTQSILRRDLISNNPSMLWSLLVALGFMLLGHYVPGLNDLLDLEPIEGVEWAIIVLMLAIFIILVEARKFAMRRYMIVKA